MSKRELPASIRAFVDAQTTVDVDQIRDAAGPVVFPYSEYWRRAIAGMLLSERIRPKNDSAPNRTDLNRICKEANFNPHLFERFGKFLIHAQIVEPARGRGINPVHTPMRFGTAKSMVSARRAVGRFLNSLTDSPGERGGGSQSLILVSMQLSARLR